ncbi:uncharacterized protein LTR77_011011 [Saxophila tyrrhenica]|uniref:C2H2-type domain-containing protein n=1 Tax=Saxophila tyrrhenica TaxID=1690608 RepID=A0AAV9NTR1_9PEZI|nr:hypothetical protein LTR77_011011 [Saxophila tyrrhenica]
MASNNDFTLYPYPDLWNNEQNFLPSSTYQDQNYLNATSFDSYQANQPYVQPDQYTFGGDQSFLSKHNLQPPSSNYSPSHAASHSFDLQPPVLSSNSDSGASIQSAISSAIGSPSAQARSSHDWSQQQTMNMLPGIVQQDSMSHDVFATTRFDLETIPITDKGCVGEFSHISSSQFIPSTPSFDTSMFPSSSFDLLREAGPFVPSTGDASWRLHSNSRSSASSERTLSVVSNLTPLQSNRVESVSPNDSVFKSPRTPASATSPVIERVKGKRKASVAPAHPKRARASSPLTHTMSYSESDLPARPNAPPPTFTSPFFSQSSGNFVPPLELSYPALIQPSYSPSQFTGNPFADMAAAQSPRNMVFNQGPSPAPSHPARSPRAPASKLSGTASPYMRTQSYQPYPVFNGSRRQSISSAHSPHSQASHSSEDSNKGLCPIAACGRHVKDLKAHMLTHQNERPEKCPIPTCEYHTKGFARKYDKNRHTLTHYKGTMVCGFCPGSGSAAEKSFNRADVFKRHLTSVHGVEQTPPNARRKSPSAAGSKKGYGREVSGMCSTCGVTFASAQDFYEHLDDCVLRVVQQADPSEAINEKLLTSIADDQQVQATMEKHMLPTGVDFSAPTSFDEDEEVEEDDDAAEEDANDGTYGSRSSRSGKGALRSKKPSVSSQHVGGGDHVSSGGAVSKPGHSKKGLTLSKNGVPLSGPMTGKGSKRRKNYPLSWGAAPEKMRMRKRVLCVYDGQRRLWKDDMMLDSEHEVRIPLNDEVGVNRAWVTDLDVQTLRRAEGIHNATEEEKGPWLDEGELERLME